MRKINLKKSKPKLSLSRQITLWFILVIVVSFAIYASILWPLFRINVHNESVLEELKRNETLNEKTIKFIEEYNKDRFREKPPSPLFFLPPNLIFRIAFILSGGVLMVIVLAASGGFLFLRKILKNISYITDNVNEIDDKKLHLRLNLKGTDPISKMAQTFDIMLDKIETYFEGQKQFLQNASHELNTPLTVIKTNIDVLKQNKKASKKDYEEIIEIIDNEITRLSKISDELIFLSKLESDIKIKYSKVNAKEVLSETLLLFKNKINDKKISIIESIPENDNEALTVLANKDMLKQIMFNLIENSVKHAPEESSMEISLYPDPAGRAVVFLTKNRADFISEKDICHLFERFYIVSSKKSGEKQGYGLGLSICKKTVESLKGSLCAEFDSKTGTITFKAVIPAYAEK